MKYTHENWKALALELLKACAKTTHSNKGNRNQRILLTLKFVIEAGICGVGCMVLSLTFSLVQAISCSWHAASVIMRLLEVVYFGKKSWPECMCCLHCAGSVKWQSTRASTNRSRQDCDCQWQQAQAPLA